MSQHEVSVQTWPHAAAPHDERSLDLLLKSLSSPLSAASLLTLAFQLWAFWHGQQCLISDHLAAALEKKTGTYAFTDFHSRHEGERRREWVTSSQRGRDANTMKSLFPLRWALAFDFSPVYTQSFRRRGQALDLWSNTLSCVRQACVTGQNDTLARATWIITQKNCKRREAHHNNRPCFEMRTEEWQHWL